MPESERRTCQICGTELQEGQVRKLDGKTIVCKGCFDIENQLRIEVMENLKMNDKHNKRELEANDLQLKRIGSKGIEVAKCSFQVTLLIMILVFVTLWLFYALDGIQGALIWWAVGGPIMGAAIAHWLPSHPPAK